MLLWKVRQIPIFLVEYQVVEVFSGDQTILNRVLAKLDVKINRSQQVVVNIDQVIICSFCNKISPQL